MREVCLGGASVHKAAFRAPKDHAEHFRLH